MYTEGLPYALFEVWFMPAGHDRTLIGAGRERRSTWIDLVCNDSEGFEKYHVAFIQRSSGVKAPNSLGKSPKRPISPKIRAASSTKTTVTEAITGV